MRGINKVIIIGNLGADPEARQFNNGGNVTNISVATSEQWTDKQSGEKKEATEWHRIVLFNRLGEIAAQYLRKGSKVYIEGSLRTRKYQDSNGQDKYITEIRADQLQMLDGKDEGQAPNNQQNSRPNQSNQGYQQPSNNQQAPNPYAQQQANKAQGMQGQVNNQFTPQNQAPQNTAMAGGGIGPIDEDIPFNRFYDGVM